MWLDSEESDEADIMIEDVLLRQGIVEANDHYFWEDQCREHNVFHLFVWDRDLPEYSCIEIGRDGTITRL
jgi:hypothetical protein